MTYHAYRQRGAYGNRVPGKIDPKIAGLVIDTTSSEVQATDVSSASWTHINSGNLLYVCYACNKHESIAGVTYDGAAMYKVGESFNYNGGDPRGAYIYRIINPSKGSHIVQVSGFMTGYFVGYAISFHSSYLEFPDRDIQREPATTGTSPEITLESSTSDIVISMLCGDGDSGGKTITDDAGQTSVVKHQSPSWLFGAGSYKNGALSTSIGYTLSSSMPYVMAAISVRG